MLLLHQYQNAFVINEEETVDGESLDQVLNRYKTAAQANTYQGLYNFAMIHFMRMNTAMGEEENIQVATDWFKRAAQKAPNNPLPLLQLGQCFKHLNQTAQVIEMCKKVIALEPENIVGHDRLAEAYVRSGELDSAISEYKQMIELDPTDCSHRMKLIDLYKLMYDKEENASDHFDRLKKDFERRIKEDANYSWAHFDLGYAYLTLTTSFSLSEEEMSTATFEFKQLMTMEPDNPWSYWGLKRVYNKESIAGKHMYDQAIQVCRQAAQRNPGNPRAYFELGEAYNENYDRPMKSEALGEYRKAVELDPFMIETHFKIASIYRIQNQHDEAIKTYKRVIALDPTSSFAKDARRSLVHIEKSRSEML